jgi:hypothetical protein
MDGMLMFQNADVDSQQQDTTHSNVSLQQQFIT